MCAFFSYYHNNILFLMNTFPSHISKITWLGRKYAAKVLSKCQYLSTILSCMCHFAFGEQKKERSMIYNTKNVMKCLLKNQKLCFFLVSLTNILGFRVKDLLLQIAVFTAWRLSWYSPLVTTNRQHSKSWKIPRNCAQDKKKT